MTRSHVPRFKKSVLLAVSALIISLELHATQAQDLTVGSLVRAEAMAPCHRTPSRGVICPAALSVEGLVASYAGTAMVVLSAAGGDTLHLVETGRTGDHIIRMLQVRRRTNRATTGLVLGGIVGVVGALAAIGPSEVLFCQGSGWTESPACGRQPGIGVNNAVVRTIGAGLLGSAIGAVVGSLFKTEKWETMDVRGLRVDLTTGRRPLVALEISF